MKNKSRLISAKFFSKLADGLADAKTVLTWIILSSGIPSFFISWLVPIRESGSMLPQVFLSGFVKKAAHTKNIAMLGTVLQAFAILFAALSVIFLDATSAGYWLMICLLGLSLSRALTSIASKDVLSNVAQKKQRGKLTGMAASLSGIVIVGSGALLMFNKQLGLNTLTYLLFIASVCWVLSTLFYYSIKINETSVQPSGSASKKDATSSSSQSVLFLRDSFRLLTNDPTFVRFVWVRSCLLGSALLSPFVLILANNQQEPSLQQLGLFVMASGIAALLSGKLWGQFADSSSKHVIQLNAVLTAIIASSLFIGFLLNLSESTFYLVIFFILQLIHQGVRVGRKTYIVDAADESNRVDYVATSNTIVGIMLLLVGVLTTFLQWLSLGFVFAFFIGLSIFGAYSSRKLPEVT